MKTKFKILESMFLHALESDIEKYINEGYKLVGSIQYVNNCYLQTMEKEDCRFDEKCTCVKKEMQDICLSFTECAIRSHINQMALIV